MKTNGSIIERKIETKGGTKTEIFALVTWTDTTTGKRVQRKKKASNRVEAKRLLRKMLGEMENHGTQTFDSDRMTFSELADKYADVHITEAKFINGRKVSGLRNTRDPMKFLQTLIDHFGKVRIRAITHGDIIRFKNTRLNEPTIKGTQRSMASVNRELEVLRSCLNFAVRNQWMPINPFSQGKGVISKAQEVSRERVLSKAEEQRLLEVCNGKRAHLKSILITALDTGLRRNELFTLTWADVNFEERLVTVQAMNAKTLKMRQVPMSQRVYEELRKLYEASTKDHKQRVFGIEDTIKRSFHTACRLAGIEGFRLHDCRHTFITRLIQAGLQPLEVMRLSGHSQVNTMYKYLNVEASTFSKAIVALDLMNQESDGDDWTEELMN